MSEPRFQYSLRSMLWLTTIASICLAIGVHYGGFAVVAAAAGLILAGAILSADWLIRPENRRALAFVTAGAWSVIGSGIVMLGVETIAATGSVGKQNLGWPIGGALVAGGLFCYVLAAWRWQQLRPKSGRVSEAPKSP
jgi:hypothetical protein